MNRAEEIKQRIAEILKEEYPEIAAEQIEIISKRFIEEGENMKDIDIQSLPERLEKAEQDYSRALRERDIAVSLAKKKQAPVPTYTNVEKCLAQLRTSGPHYPASVYENAVDDIVKKHQREDESFAQAYSRLTREHPDAATLVDAALISKSRKQQEDRYAGLNPMHQPTAADPRKLGHKNQAYQAEAEMRRQVALLSTAEGIDEAEAYDRFLKTPQGKKLYAVLVGAEQPTDWDSISL